MIPTEKLEWLGLKLLDHRVLFINITTLKSVLNGINLVNFTTNCKKESNGKQYLKLGSLNKIQINGKKNY